MIENLLPPVENLSLLINNPLEKCVNYQASRVQREEELSRGLSLEGTMGYEKAGCYECDGKNTSCERYFVSKKKNNSFK